MRRSMARQAPPGTSTQTTAGSQPLYPASLIGGKPGFSIADANDWVVGAAAELDNITAAGFCLHQVWRSGASLSPQTIWKGIGAAGWTCQGQRIRQLLLRAKRCRQFQVLAARDGDQHQLCRHLRLHGRERRQRRDAPQWKRR